MTLLEIFKPASLALNQTPSTPEARAIMLEFINAAARDFWLRTDLRDSLAEDTIYVASGNLIALPETIGEIRAVRDCFGKVLVGSRAARYQTGNWDRANCRNFAVRERSPLKVSPADLTSITVSLQEPDENTVTVLITGPTTAATERVYTFVIPAGETSVTLSTALVTPVTAISKNVKTLSNVTITDADDVEISMIPNNATEISYIILQLGDRCGCADDCGPDFAGRHFDLLYKKAFIPLVNDTDIFPISGSEAEFLMAMKEYKMMLEMPSGVDSMNLIVQKQRRLQVDSEGNENNGIVKRIDTGANPFQSLSYGDQWATWNRRDWFFRP